MTAQSRPIIRRALVSVLTLGLVAAGVLLPQDRPLAPDSHSMIAQAQALATSTPAPTTPLIYSGVYAPLGTSSDPLSNLRQFESDAGKGASIEELYWFWTNYPCSDPRHFPSAPFPQTLMDTIRNHGSIPYVDFRTSPALGIGTMAGDPNEPCFALKYIVNGTYDSYLVQWAKDAAAWGHPFFLRFDAEMNTPRYAYSALANGNSIPQFVQAWDHVQDIFRRNGASNVTWVWCVTPQGTGPGNVPLSQLSQLYPGDSRVDWVGYDGENYGNNAATQSTWQTFAQVMNNPLQVSGQPLDSYDYIAGNPGFGLKGIAPSKPIVVETASNEDTDLTRKANWIGDAYQTQIPTAFPNVKAVVWLNAAEPLINVNQPIESSANARQAFAQSIALPVYASNQFANLSTSPIGTLGNVPINTPVPGPMYTPTPSPTPVGIPQLNTAKAQADTTIASILTGVSAVSATVQSNVALSGTAQMQVATQLLNSNTSALLSLKARIDAVTDPTQITTVVAPLITSVVNLHIPEVVLPQASDLVQTAALINAMSPLTSTAATLASAIAQARSYNRNASTAQADYNSFVSEIARIATDIQTNQSLIVSLSPLGYPANQTVVQQIQSNFATISQEMTTASTYATECGAALNALFASSSSGKSLPTATSTPPAPSPSRGH